MKEKARLFLFVAWGAPFLFSVLHATPLFESVRVVSLKAAEINVRVGPGPQYPVVWMLLCAGLPVRVVAEFELWRKIEDPFGTKGWVHKNLLSKRKTVFLLREQLLYAEPRLKATPVARLAYGVVAERRETVSSEGGLWHWVKVKGMKGFIPQEACWDGRPMPPLPCPPTSDSLDTDPSSSAAR